MFTRRNFLFVAGAAATGTLLPVAPARAAEPSSFVPLASARRKSLLAALKSEEAKFDPVEQMILTGAGGPGYHTTIKTGRVHGTRASVAYAAALLDSGEPKDLERAQAILRKMISLQDQNPESKTYGIWSWYLEEPLAKMSPPDWNWADFCGVQLLHAWISHRDRLNPELRRDLKNSILHAARSIQRRNVGLGYTNIAIMGTYVTLAAGEHLPDEGLSQYARDRLRRFHAYTFQQGSFTEYNSPTYTMVALSELSRTLLHVRAEDDRKLVRELHDFAWKHVATHFHAPTAQWAGPHSRSYEDDLRKPSQTLAFLTVGTGLDLISQDPLPLGLDYYRLQMSCPADLVTYFKELPSPRTTIETF